MNQGYQPAKTFSLQNAEIKCSTSQYRHAMNKGAEVTCGSAEKDAIIKAKRNVIKIKEVVLSFVYGTNSIPQIGTRFSFDEGFFKIKTIDVDVENNTIYFDCKIL